MSETDEPELARVVVTGTGTGTGTGPDGRSVIESDGDRPVTVITTMLPAKRGS